MKTDIYARVEQLKGLRSSVSLNPNESIDKSSYLQMVDMNIEALTDILTLIEAVNSDDSETVSNWFERFKT